jgi:predicted amidohydrolase
MLVAIAQLQSSSNAEENLSKAKLAIQRAHARGAQLIVFPEIFMAWLSPTEYTPKIAKQRAQPISGPFVQHLQMYAREAEMWTIAGMLETSAGTEKIYNTTIVVNHRGELLKTYHKTHMFDAFGYKESDIFLAGDQLFEPLDTPFGRMGLLVCYELRFPEIARHQSSKGVDFFVIPSAWVHGAMKETHWRSLVTSRAIENTAYVIACNQSGHQFLGRSLIVDPMGVVRAEGSEQEDLLFADIDLSRVHETRTKIPSLKHRRPELYQE